MSDPNVTYVPLDGGADQVKNNMQALALVKKKTNLPALALALTQPGANKAAHEAAYERFIADGTLAFLVLFMLKYGTVENTAGDRVWRSQYAGKQLRVEHYANNGSLKVVVIFKDGRELVVLQNADANDLRCIPGGDDGWNLHIKERQEAFERQAELDAQNAQFATAAQAANEWMQEV